MTEIKDQIDADTAKDWASQNGVIATYMGHQFAPLDPDPADVDIEDIAHALANNCRFTGHVKQFYSVAQHSVLCSELVQEREDGNKRYALEALLHDASEAYLSDIARPIKSQPEFGDVYKAVEGRLEYAIAVRFELEFPWPEVVKWADNVLLRSEQRDLMPDILRFHGDDYLQVAIQPWTPGKAEQLFLRRFRELQAGRAS